MFGGRSKNIANGIHDRIIQEFQISVMLLPAHENIVDSLMEYVDFYEDLEEVWPFVSTGALAAWNLVVLYASNDKTLKKASKILYDLLENSFETKFVFVQGPMQYFLDFISESKSDLPQHILGNFIAATISGSEPDFNISELGRDIGDYLADRQSHILKLD